MAGRGLRGVMTRGVALALAAGLTIPMAGTAVAVPQPSTDSKFGQELSSVASSESTNIDAPVEVDPESGSVDSVDVSEESDSGDLDVVAPVLQGSVENSTDVEISGELGEGETLTDTSSEGVVEFEDINSLDSSSQVVATATAQAAASESPDAKGIVVPRLPQETAAGIQLNNQWSSKVTAGFTFGRATDSFLVGDWDGDGIATLAVRDGNTYYMTNRHGDGLVSSSFTYGEPTDEVFVGDWDGDGKDSLAFRRGDRIYIKNAVSGSTAATSFKFGKVSDTLFIGDWDGDGKDSFAVRNGAKFSIHNSLTSSTVNVEFIYGRVNDDVLVGDWNGNGKDTFVVRRGNVYHVRNSLTSGGADKIYTFGAENDEAIVGDWDGNGTDTLGKIRRDGVVPAVNKESNPQGAFEAVTPNNDGTISVRGWGFDPDLNGGMTVQLYVDQDPQLIRASLQRSDIKKSFNLSSDKAGFGKTFKVSSGKHKVCATLINEGAGSNTFLGCLDVEAKVKADSAPTTKPTPTPTPKPPTPEKGPANVGIPSGVKLKKTTGNMYITKAGTVVDGIDLYGRVIVQAPNVVIKNSFIRGDGTTKKTPVVLNQSTDLLIKDSEIAARTPHPDVLGVIGSNFTLERVNIHDVLDPVHIFGEGNVVVKDSWLHGNLHFESLPELNGGPSHDDSIQIISGSNIVITGNKMEGSYGAAIQFTQDRGRVSNVRVEDNFIGGGGCSLNFAEKGRGPFKAITVKNNLFDRDQRLKGCAVIRPVTSEIKLAGNTWVDGAPVQASRGG